jgi:hypothetical protein
MPRTPRHAMIREAPANPGAAHSSSVHDGHGGYEVPDRLSWQFPILQKPFSANTLIAVVNTLIPCV